MPVTRLEALSQTGFTPRYHSACARSSPPVRSDAEAQRSITSARGGSP